MRLLFFQLLIFMALVVILEGSAMLWLDERSHDFLFASPKLADQDKGSGKIYQNLDPLLGWAANRDQPYVLINGSGASDRAFKILVTGGSTSETFGNDGKWPAVMTRELQRAGFCVKTYAAAVSGYNSSQELLKVLRDSNALKPDLHISYSGTNEMFDPDWHFMPTKYQNYLFTYLATPPPSPVFPNLQKLLADILGNAPKVMGFQKGLVQPKSRAHRWQLNMRRMNALARLEKSHFIGVLQPTLGFGDYQLSTSERQYLEENGTIATFADFYRDAQRFAKNKMYMSSFVDVYRGMSDVYIDDCHVKPFAHRHLGKRMAKEILSRVGKEALKCHSHPSPN